MIARHRARAACAALAFSALALVPIAAQAQAFPSRPLRLIVPFGPGSTVDIMARALSQPLTEQFGQSVVVDNKPGAGGTLGVDAIAKAAKDGYTVGIGTTGPLTINPALQSRMPFDTLADLAPVSLVATGPNAVLVNPSVPAKNVKELIAYARANPGALNFASSGVGSTNHLAGELFKSVAGIQMVHVPYKGNGEALADLMAGRVQVLFSGLPPVMSQVQAGKARVLAIAGPSRAASLPEVPTVAEAGLPGSEVVVWYGVLAPAGTPKDVLARLHAEVVKAMARPDIRARFTEAGSDPASSTPEEFSRMIRADLTKWKQVITSANIKVE
jgi:tripartite-type tricarboxylate transporter receptor subunit TctC